MAPVNFDLGDRKVSPYSISPWAKSGCSDDTPNLLKVLRGDFFCLPFGGSECSPHPHGATANLDWKLLSSSDNKLILEIKPEDIGGSVTKEISLVDGQHAIYQQHRIAGVDGSYNYGHHPIIEFPEEGGPFEIRTSPFKYGQVYPGPFENPDEGGHSSLKQGAVFDSLDNVPLADGGSASLLSYPARDGFDDLVLFSALDDHFAWTVITLDGYAWIALKDPKQFPSTLFWISNGGRDYTPWNKEHRRRIGIEDVCSYFHEGCEKSPTKNHLNELGIPTSNTFEKENPTVLKHIQMVHPIDAEFGTVESIQRDEDGKGIFLINKEGEREFAAVNWKFL